MFQGDNKLFEVVSTLKSGLSNVIKLKGYTMVQLKSPSLMLHLLAAHSELGNKQTIQKYKKLYNYI